MGDKNFGQLGSSFQMALIRAIIEDKKYGETLINVIETKFFDNNSFKFIVENLKELFNTYNKIPDYNTLGQKIMTESGDKARIHLDMLENIKNNNQDLGFVKDTALNFCKQQNLKRELKNVQSIIDNADFEEYKKIETIIQKALEVGSMTEEAIDVFHNIDDALQEGFRHPIPTGIDGIDNLLKGGLGKGEFGVILAPTGVGKTTLLTKIANTAYTSGLNVLQIIFEDNVDVIKRKHYTIWSGVAPDEQPQHKDYVKECATNAQKHSKGVLKILKFPSVSVTVTDIKTKLRKMASDGMKIDMLIVDYVDCLTAEKNPFGDEWKGEGAIMRSLESMTSEFDIALWVATQGNRESISSEVVTTNQMGGSIKKAQIGHVVISVGKTLEQKEHKLATITLLKSRIGRDGVVFQNCRFDNELIIIDTDAINTLLGHEEEKVKNNQLKARDAYLKRLELTKNKDK